MSSNPSENKPADMSISEQAIARMQTQAEASLPKNLRASLDNLNDAQREAVMAGDGPLLVLAGAGTGKTKMLTTRIAYKLASRQAWPEKILAVTFTNNAAREMRERIAQLTGDDTTNMAWLGTFHSIAARILRRHAELVGLRSNFTILDADDEIRLLKQLIQEAGIDEKRWPAKQLAGSIDRWKNRGWHPYQVPKNEGKAFADGKGLHIYENYQQRLKTLNAADFGNLLLECLRLLMEHDDVRQRYEDRFQHILVDEYQDTNTVQYLWLRLLAQKHHNICCVGDDDQSIYGWRGAEIDNILRFEKDFPGAKIIRLEQNYRSTGHILGAAAGLIAGNKQRLGKTLWTQDADGEKVLIRAVYDSEEEARRTAMDIEDLQRGGHNLYDMAILVRASFQMREFEDRFITLALPYRVVGGPRFYERAEIRDANAYLRLIAQNNDDLAFERICNKPRRGLGDATLQTLHYTARAQKTSLAQAAAKLTDTEEIRPAARRALADFLQDIEKWREAAGDMPPQQLAETVLNESGYLRMWEMDKSPDAPGRVDNLKELIRSIEGFPSLEAYLEHIALVMEATEHTHDNAEGKISLMTLHAAKGLEFETVFLPGWEEEIFPNPRSLDENGDRALEEERRLAYVGLTRAKKRAVISFAASRRIHGKWHEGIPSRFIDQLPKDHTTVDKTTTTPLFNMTGGAGKTNMANAANALNTLGAANAPSAADALSAAADSHSPFTQGERVFHQKFGYGMVEMIDGNKMTIAFEKAGRKKVIDSYVEKTD